MPMATLTYDATPADQPELNADEQESLAIGEQMAAEEQNLLAGKYANAQELEKAYLELQSKFGERSNEVQASGDEGEEEPAAEEEVETEEEPKASITEQEAQQLQESVGGAQAYQELIKWAGENLSEQEIGMFDSVVGTGDMNACYFAIQNLARRYAAEATEENPLLSGKGSPERVDVFRSQAEVVAAMQDPRYDKDPAFRQDVYNKLERSELNY